MAKIFNTHSVIEKTFINNSKNKNSLSNFSTHVTATLTLSFNRIPRIYIYTRFKLQNRSNSCHGEASKWYNNMEKYGDVYNWNDSKITMCYHRNGFRIRILLTIKSILNVLVILYARWCVTLRPLRFTDSFRKNGRDIHNTGRFVKLKTKAARNRDSQLINCNIVVFVSKLFDSNPLGMRLDGFLFVLSRIKLKINLNSSFAFTYVRSSYYSSLHAHN